MRGKVALMPYATNHDLPASLQHTLPEDAQEIFREAFNSAWKSYGRKDPEKSRGDRPSCRVGCSQTDTNGITTKSAGLGERFLTNRAEARLR
jgi:cation transport regulator ChaB